MAEQEQVVGVIGGTGLYELEGLSDLSERRVDTPFGEPSDTLLSGRLGEVRLFFLSRHGRGHLRLPSEINFRANIYALKKVGCQRVISVSAVGSLREDIRPGDLVIVDQFFDRTRSRQSTFFGDGAAVHIEFADPVCGELAAVVHQAAEQQGYRVHRGGTYLCIEGPQFSTRAESRVYRSWGLDVIGMTNLPEAKLAREAGLCYATIALVTDYDVWHEAEEDVSADLILARLRENVAKAQGVILRAVPRLQPGVRCRCRQGPESALVTDRAHLPPSSRELLEFFAGHPREEKK